MKKVEDKRSAHQPDDPILIEQARGGNRVLQGYGQQFTYKDGFQTRDREMISGFFQILAKSYDEAMEIAKTCPHLKI